MEAQRQAIRWFPRILDPGVATGSHPDVGVTTVSFTHNCDHDLSRGVVVSTTRQSWIWQSFRIDPVLTLHAVFMIDDGAVL